MQALCNLARSYGPIVGRILIIKNLAILGALVYIMAMGSGPFSLGKESKSASAC